MIVINMSEDLYRVNKTAKRRLNSSRLVTRNLGATGGQGAQGGQCEQGGSRFKFDGN